MGIPWNCKDIIIFNIIIIRIFIANIKPILPFMYSPPELFQVFLKKISKKCLISVWVTKWYHEPYRVAEIVYNTWEYYNNLGQNTWTHGQNFPNKNMEH